MVTKIFSFNWKSGLELAMGQREHANPYDVIGRREIHSKTQFDQEISEISTTVQGGRGGSFTYRTCIHVPREETSMQV